MKVNKQGIILWLVQSVLVYVLFLHFWVGHLAPWAWGFSIGGLITLLLPLSRLRLYFQLILAVIINVLLSFISGFIFNNDMEFAIELFKLCLLPCLATATLSWVAYYIFVIRNVGLFRK